MRQGFSRTKKRQRGLKPTQSVGKPFGAKVGSEYVKLAGTSLYDDDNASPIPAVYRSKVSRVGTKVDGTIKVSASPVKTRLIARTGFGSKTEKLIGPELGIVNASIDSNDKPLTFASVNALKKRDSNLRKVGYFIDSPGTMDEYLSFGPSNRNRRRIWPTRPSKRLGFEKKNPIRNKPVSFVVDGGLILGLLGSFGISSYFYRKSMVSCPEYMPTRGRICGLPMKSYAECINNKFTEYKKCKKGHRYPRS